MKKLFLFVSVTISLTLVAQNDSLRNGGFESWIDHNGNYEEPGGWYSLNFLYAAGFEPTCLKTADRKSGNYALLLESKNGPGGTDIPGLLCSNFMFAANGMPDFNKNFIPFTSRPVSLDFYYKLNITGADSAGGFMMLSRWNSQSGKRDTIGFAGWTATGIVNTYTKAVIPFIYYSNLQPDSASVIFSSSLEGFNPTAGSQLFLDDLKVNYSNASLNEDETFRLSAYPNPVSHHLYIENGNDASFFDVYSMDGKIIEEGIPIFDQMADLSLIPAGIYLVTARTREHAITGRTRIIKN